jgi:hypothetical protein
MLELDLLKTIHEIDNLHRHKLSFFIAIMNEKRKKKEKGI